MGQSLFIQNPKEFGPEPAEAPSLSTWCVSCPLEQQPSTESYPQAYLARFLEGCLSAPIPEKRQGLSLGTRMDLEARAGPSWPRQPVGDSGTSLHSCLFFLH